MPEGTVVFGCEVCQREICKKCREALRVDRREVVPQREEAPPERRVDPEDSTEYTWDEFYLKFSGVYTDAEVSQYWFEECHVVQREFNQIVHEESDIKIANAMQNLSLGQ